MNDVNNIFSELVHFNVLRQYQLFRQIWRRFASHWEEWIVNNIVCH